MAKGKHTETFVVDNFDIFYAAEQAMMAINTNTLSRLRNNLVHLINRHATLPKFIVIILEADVINEVRYKDFGASTAYGNVLDWLMAEYRKIISGFKDAMPNKCKIIDEPHVMWIQATRHKNYVDDEARGKFNNCLRILANVQENSSVYYLQQLWDTRSSSLVLPHNGRMTFEGVCTLWDAMDRTIKYGVAKYMAGIEKAKIANHLQTRKAQFQQGTSSFRRRLGFSGANSCRSRPDRQNWNDRQRKLPQPPNQ